MKKLNKVLFGFGSVAAVVAPVAAVVACGDKDTKFDWTEIKSGAELKTYAAKFDYTLAETIADNSFKELGGTSTHPLKVKAFKHTPKPGKEKNIAIIVKGTQKTQQTDATQAQKDDLANFDGRWDFSVNDLNDINFVAFLHTYSQDEKTAQKLTKDHSISWLEIQKDTNNNLVAVDIPTATPNRF